MTDQSAERKMVPPTYLVKLRCTPGGVSTVFKLAAEQEHDGTEDVMFLSSRPECIEYGPKGEMALKAIDGQHLGSTIIAEIDQFIDDPPATDFERGYLAALVSLYREGLDHMRLQADARIDAAEQLIAEAFVTEIPHA